MSPSVNNLGHCFDFVDLSYSLGVDEFLESAISDLCVEVTRSVICPSGLNKVLLTYLEVDRIKLNWGIPRKIARMSCYVVGAKIQWNINRSYFEGKQLRESTQTLFRK